MRDDDDILADYGIDSAINWFVCVLQKEVTRLLVALDDFHTRFYPMVFLLHLIVHKLPSSPLGKQVCIATDCCIFSVVSWKVY